MNCPTTGKVCLTRDAAMKTAAWWRRTRFARMNHYRCTDCDSWHIGNRSTRYARGHRRKARR